MFRNHNVLIDSKVFRDADILLDSKVFRDPDVLLDNRVFSVLFASQVFEIMMY